MALLWLLLLATVATSAPITQDNVRQLRPVTTVLFEEAAEMRSGWFALSTDGTQAAVAAENGDIHIVDVDGSMMLAYNEPDLASAVWFNGRLYAAHSDNQTVILRTWRDGATTREVLPIEGVSGFPADVHVGRGVTMVHLLQPDGSTRIWLRDDAGQVSEQPFAPGREGAVVRIGRIPPPYVVTSTLDGMVRLWHWGGATLAETSNGLGIPSAFGNINPRASHLVWRDNNSTMLYLLDFLTGENRPIAPLDGRYVQWFFLSGDVSVALGVNREFVPHVYAWLTETGELLDLGPYLACERPQPDMARLSADGTTLVIGCDAGLQFWRVRRGS